MKLEPMYRFSRLEKLIGNENINKLIVKSNKGDAELEKRLVAMETQLRENEKAVQDKRNIIIAPNGRVGNIIFRTMVLLNSWPSYGAVTFGMDRVYIDTSRDQSIEGYLRSLVLAEELIED